MHSVALAVASILPPAVFSVGVVIWKYSLRRV